MADKLRLLLALAILAAGIGGFYYLGGHSDVVRVLTVLVAAGVAFAVALQTEPGRAGWEFAKGARAEFRKVVWPTGRETVQVTLAVFVIVVLIALFLWIVDWALLKGIGALTRQGI